VLADFREQLSLRQAAIEKALQFWCERLIVDAPPALAEAIRYSLFAPGKRLRPLLAVLACEAAGGSIEQATPAAVAVEMLHTYSLIHDDLPSMDNDDLRRGLPTSHVRFGEGLAILTGDALLTMAFEVLGLGCPPRTVAVSTLELARGAGPVGMVGGQVLDLEAEGKIQPQQPAELASEASLENIHHRKTGALIRSALRMGLFGAQAELPDGVRPNALEAIDRYADAFGLAFQVTDDLLDVEGSAELAGKRVGKDAARGKLTYPGLLGIEASRMKAKQLGQAAVAAAAEFGPPGDRLAWLARSVVERNR
jgi:geranylgeranyl diphosphate synthase, type II